MTGIVYRLVNKLNGMSYVGQTRQGLDRRLRQHERESFCRRLHNAIKKYTLDNFYVETLGTYAAIEELNDAEQYYIEYYNCLSPDGYNLDTGGKNKVCSDETRKLMSENSANKGKKPWNTGKQLTAEHKKKISGGIAGDKNPMFGKTHSEEVRQKIALQATGRMASDETRCKMSMRKKGKKHSVESITKMILTKKLRITPYPKASAETKARMSAVRKGRPWTQARRDAHNKTKLQGVK